MGIELPQRLLLGRKRSGAREKAARILEQNMKLMLEALRDGQESVLAVVQHQGLLIAAEQAKRLPTAEALARREAHCELAERIHALVRARFEEGQTTQRDVLTAQANLLLRQADQAELRARTDEETVRVMQKSIRDGALKEIQIRPVQGLEG